MSDEQKRKEESHLHKVYRAVFDNVCPNCGGVMKVMPLGTRQCGCGFNVTELEMARMRPAVKAVLAEPVKTFEAWREQAAGGSAAAKRGDAT